VAVRAVILRDGLVALTAFDDESGYHYNLPGGGLEHGESLYAGLRREVREEMGCEIEIGPLLLAYESQPAPNLVVPPYAIHGLGLFFLCTLAPGSEPHLPTTGDANEIDVCWVPLIRLKDAPLLPQVGAHLERAIADLGCKAGTPRDLLVIEDVHTFPQALPNWQPLPPFVVSTEAQRGVPLGGLFNCRQVTPALFIGGMPTAKQLQALAEAGFAAVINLAPCEGGRCLPDEEAICAQLGLGYVHLPISWEAPTVAGYLAFERALTGFAGKRVLVHCRRNMRASTFAYLWLVRHGENEPAARAMLHGVWMPNPTWQALIEAVLAL